MREVVVLGVGLHPWGIFDETPMIDMAIEATNKALQDAGLEFNDIQSICACGSEFVQLLGRGMLGNVLCDLMGGTGIDTTSTRAGCSGSLMAIHNAFLDIASGRKDIAMAVGADKTPRGLTSYSIQEDIRDRNFVITNAVGAGNPAFWAMNMRRRMHEYGTTEEQFAQVAIKAHRNGVLNPYARYRKEISMDKILSSPLVANPLRLLEICSLSHGAAAIILCSAEKARQLTNNPVYMVTTALGSKHFGEPLIDWDISMISSSPAPHTSARAAAVWRCYEQAGIGPEDIDFVEHADLSVWHEFDMLESWGFCKPGEADEMILSGQTEINGKLPVNPSGGFQSFGEATAACGMWQIAESVWQLRGQSQQRQVNNPKVCICEVNGVGPTSGAAVLKV
jgi:acetyl-CoA acetyltransferase